MFWEWKKYPIVTIALIVVNVVLFLICTFDHGVLYKVGSISMWNLITEGQYYRMVSSMFLHADIEHLVNNMLLLYGLGYMIEKEIGSIRFFLYYMLSGLGGNLFSISKEWFTGYFYSSIGASGAVYGLIGMLLIFAVTNREHFPTVTWKNVLFVIFYGLYTGYESIQVNNAAHIGGIITGLLLGGVFSIRLKLVQAR